MMNLARYLAVAVVLGTIGLGYCFLRGANNVTPSSSSAGAEANPLPSFPNGETLATATEDVGESIRSAPKEGQQRDRRPIEALLTTPEGLGPDLANIAADAKKFDDTVQNLEDQYYSDIEARKLTNTYSQQINARFSDAGAGLSLQKVACGVLVCAARFSGKQLSQTDFADLLMTTRDGDQRLYSAVIQIEPPSPDGSPDATYRAFFSSDPQANRIIVKP